MILFVLNKLTHKAIDDISLDKFFRRVTNEADIFLLPSVKTAPAKISFLIEQLGTDNRQRMQVSNQLIKQLTQGDRRNALHEVTGVHNFKKVLNKIRPPQKLLIVVVLMSLADPQVLQFIEVHVIYCVIEEQVCLGV